jgi:hydrogenase small subunit
MATLPVPRWTDRPPDVKELHILWITAGLSCDGDGVSVTATEQPSIEDVLIGAIPGLPKVHDHRACALHARSFYAIWSTA